MKTGKEMAIDVFAEIEMRQNAMKNNKKMSAGKVAVLVFAMICVLCMSAFAAYHFAVPGELEESLGTKLVNIQPVLSENANSKNSQVVADTARTDGCTIKFEAIADAEAIRPVLTSDSSGKKIEINVQDKFAIFSVRSNDGSSLENKYSFSNNPLGYCVGVPGYSPNNAAFGYNFGDFYDKENNTLIIACLINEAEVFADEKPYIALFSGSAYASVDFLRMDENGQPYFMEDYDGLKAIFELPLDPSLADEAVKSEMLKTRAFVKNVDYSISDKLLAMDKEFRESGTDLSAYIGDNEWLGRYPLQFGKVSFSDIYLQHRNDWSEKEIRLLTASELDAVAVKSDEKINEKYLISEEKYALMTKEEQIDYDIMIKEKVDNAVYCGGIPQDADYITLPDGSKAYYCYGFVFLHVGTDSRLSMVIVPNHKTVIEIFGIDSILNTEFIPSLYNPEENKMGAVSPLTEYGNLIDNVSAGSDSGENHDFGEGFNINDMIESDAEYETISYWSAYPGTVEVIAE